MKFLATKVEQRSTKLTTVTLEYDRSGGGTLKDIRNIMNAVKLFNNFMYYSDKLT